MLVCQAAARSTASVCDQWLNRPPVQLTLSVAVSCMPTFWFHGASNLVRIFNVKLKGPRSAGRTSSCCWRVVRLAAVESMLASEQTNSSLSVIMALCPVKLCCQYDMALCCSTCPVMPDQTSIEVDAAPNLEQPLSASNSIFVTKTAGCCSLKPRVESLSALLRVTLC